MVVPKSALKCVLLHQYDMQTPTQLSNKGHNKIHMHARPYAEMVFLRWMRLHFVYPRGDSLVRSNQ